MLASAALAVLSAPGAAEAQNRYALTLQNDSSYDIYHLFMSTTETDQWGPDQLGDHILEVDTDFTINQIPPGEYDLKFVDEDGDECVLVDIQVFQDETWSITDDALLDCEGFGDGDRGALAQKVKASVSRAERPGPASARLSGLKG